MKNQFVLVSLALFMFLGAAHTSAQATNQKWTAGWRKFNEPLSYKSSKVTWSVNPATNKLSGTFKLVGAAPNKLYQVTLQLFCNTSLANFGKYPVVFLNLVFV